MYFIKRADLDALKEQALCALAGLVDPTGLRVLAPYDKTLAEKAVLQALSSIIDDPHAVVLPADIAHLAKVDDEYIVWPPMRTTKKEPESV